MRTPLSRRVLAGATSMAIGGVFVAASAMVALADSPAPSSLTATVAGTTVTVSGTLLWGGGCKSGAGYGVVWNDTGDPGLPLANAAGVLVGLSAAPLGGTDTAANLVHPAPGCAIGPISHTYTAANLPSQVCAVGFHYSDNVLTGFHSKYEGGPAGNTDNSVSDSDKKNAVINPPFCVDLVVPHPDVTIAKTATPTVKVGHDITYAITVTNDSSPAMATDQTLTVDDPMPAGVTFKSVSAGAGWSCNNASPVHCTYPAHLAAGDSAPVITVVGTATAAAPSNIVNTATVSNPDDSNTGNNTASATTTLAALTPDVTIHKTATPTVAVNDNITYTISVSNDSTDPTDRTLTVTDNLPAGVSFVSDSPGAGWSCTGTQSLTCTYAGSLAAGAHAPDITVVAQALAAAVPSVTNITDVTNSDDSNPNNNEAQATTVVTPLPQPDVTIHKTATPTARVGQPITYTLTVTNDSTVATDRTLSVTDAVPATVQVTNVAGGNGWNCTGLQSVSCTFAGSLAAGASAPAITVTGTALAGAAPSVTNTGIVANPDDANPNNNQDTATTTVPAPAPSLSLTKSADPVDGSTVSRGQRIDYTLHYSNAGDGDANGVDISDVVPAHTSYVDGSAACSGACTATFDSANNSVHWSLDIPANTNGDVTFAVTVDSNTDDGTIITNVGHLVSGSTTVPSNEVQHQVFVPSGDLQLVKSVNPTKAVVGTTLTYTLVATATGNIVQHDVVVTDTVPDGTTFASADCAAPCAASFSSGVATWALGDLQPGQSMSMTFAVTVNGPAADGTLPTSIPNVGHVRSTETPRTPSNRVVVPVTTVLGEKTVKTPPTTTLPFTGLPVLQDSLLAAVLIGAGLMLLSWPRLYRTRRQAV